MYYVYVAKNKTTIVEAGALRPLIVQLSTDNVEVQCNACGCITTLATVGQFTLSLLTLGVDSPYTQR